MRTHLKKILILACLITVSYQAQAVTQYHQTACANGYGGAYTITDIDILGCILKIVGVDCSGNPINYTPPRIVIIPNDPALVPTFEFGPGLVSSTGWYVRVETDAGGNPIKVWGRMSNGDYYITW